MANTLMSLLVKLGVDSSALDTGLAKAEGDTKNSQENMATSSADMANTIAISLMAVAGAALVIGKTVQASVGTLVTSATAVEKFRNETGMLTTDSSRLLVVLKDLGISAEDVDTAFKFAEKNGFQPTIQSLESMQKLYLALEPGMERTQFLLDNFGKSGNNLQKFFETGDIATRLEAVNKALILDPAALASVNKYKDQLNNLSNTWTGLKMNVGELTLPIIISVLTTFNTDTNNPNTLLGKEMENLSTLGNKTVANVLTWDPKWGPQITTVTTKIKDATIATKMWNDAMKEAMVGVNTDNLTQVINAQTNATKIYAQMNIDYWASIAKAGERTQGEAERLNRSYKISLVDVTDQMGLYARSSAYASVEMFDLTKIIQDQNVLLEKQKLFIAGVDWEVLYTGEKTAADKIKDSISLIGDDLKGLGYQGSLVWEGYLAATGQISPAAITQFVKITAAFKEVKRSLEAGISIPIIIQNLTTELTGAGVTTGANVISTGKGWSSADANGWETNSITGGMRNITTGQNVAYWAGLGYDLGGTFKVPLGFDNDRFPVRVSSGEVVSVTPAGATPAGNQAPNVNNFYITNPKAVATENSISDAMLKLSFLGVAK